MVQHEQKTMTVIMFSPRQLTTYACEHFFYEHIVFTYFGHASLLRLPVQVQDYACALKMDQGKLVLKHQVLLLKVFLCIGGPRARDYEKALLASLAVWLHLRRIRHPAWLMFKYNASVFNEECGEISFSALARQVARGGSRSDLHHANKQFQLLKRCMETASDFNVELNGPEVTQKRGKIIDPLGQDVDATVAFFNRTINNIVRRQFRIYDDDLGDLGKGCSGDARQTVLFRDEVVLAFGNSARLAEKILPKLQSMMGTDYLRNHTDVWNGPAEQKLPSEMASDSENSGDEPDYDLTEVIEQKVAKEPRQQSNLEAAQPAKKKRKIDSSKPHKTSHQLNLEAMVGRVLKVPASSIWTSRSVRRKMFEKPSEAILHMRIWRVDVKHKKKPLVGKFVHPDEDDPDYELRFSLNEAKRLLAKPNIAYVDTPLRSDYEDSDEA